VSSIQDDEGRMKKRKAKSLGRGFLNQLKILELCERTVVDSSKSKSSMSFELEKLGYPLFRVASAMGLGDANTDRFIAEVVERWANDAADVRESFKFRANDETLLLSGPYPETEFIMPFDKTTLVVNVLAGVVPDAEEPMTVLAVGKSKPELFFYIEKRVTPEDYRKLKAGDEFYSISTGIFNPESSYGNTGGIFPFEVHIPLGEPIPADHTRILEDMSVYLGVPEMISEDFMPDFYRAQLVAQINVCRFVQILARGDYRKQISPGLKPGVTHLARSQKYPMYEHTTVEIDLTPEQRASQGKFNIEGRHHRLHPVRGHWRTLHSGKKTWIKSHWRGDDHLGVVTHDYELVESDFETLKPLD
jgi:hypothetical protein